MWVAKIGLVVKSVLDATGPFLLSFLKMLVGIKQQEVEVEHGVDVVDAPEKRNKAHQGALKRLKR